MAHRRTSSILHHQERGESEKLFSSSNTNTNTMPAHSSAVGLGLNSIMSAAANVAQSFPAMRDSDSFETLQANVLLLPPQSPHNQHQLSPGTPSKSFPHPPRISLPSSSPSPSSSSSISSSSSSPLSSSSYSTSSSYSSGSPRTFLRRLASLFSPVIASAPGGSSPSSSLSKKNNSNNNNILPLKSPLHSPTRLTHAYPHSPSPLLSAKSLLSYLLLFPSRLRFLARNRTTLTSSSSSSGSSIGIGSGPLLILRRRRSLITFLALLALVLLSAWTILTTSLSSSSSSTYSSSSYYASGPGAGAAPGKGWRELYLGKYNYNYNDRGIKDGGGGLGLGVGVVKGSNNELDDRLLALSAKFGTNNGNSYSGAVSPNGKKKKKTGGRGRKHGKGKKAKGVGVGAIVGAETKPSADADDDALVVDDEFESSIEGEEIEQGREEEEEEEEEEREEEEEDDVYKFSSPRAELAALTSFMAALPWNALPSYVDPTRPIPPDLVLDFDLRGLGSRRQGGVGREDEKLAEGSGSASAGASGNSVEEEMVRETWKYNPVVVFGKSRHARTRELKALLEGGLVVVDTSAAAAEAKRGQGRVKAVGVRGITYFEMDGRVDRDVVEPVLRRLLFGSPSSSSSSSSSSKSSSSTLEYPILLVGGEYVPIGPNSEAGEEEHVAMLERERVRKLVDVPALRAIREGAGAGNENDANPDGGDGGKVGEEGQMTEREDGESELVRMLRAAGARLEEVKRKKGKGR